MSHAEAPPRHGGIRELLAALALALFAGCGGSGPRPESKQVVQAIAAVAVDGQRDSAAPTYIAIVRADRETELSFKVPGVIELIGARPGQDWQEGDLVEQDALLARLRQGDFTNAVNSARAREELGRSTFDRNQQLRTQGAISAQELDVLRGELRAAEAALGQATQNLQDSQLRAPAAGTILARAANTGETVAPGRAVLRVGDLRTVSVELGVPDRAVGKFRKGKTVPVTISALENLPPFSGVVDEVGVAAREDARLFKVIVKVDNQQGLIRPGMTASVPLEDRMALPAGAVKIPLSALVAVPGAESDRNLAVFVVDADNRARLRAVQTGEIVESSILVLQGLKPNEPVVVLGASQLHDGALVEIQLRKPAAHR